MALPITPQLVERAAAGLASGGWRFTLRQLYYASCAEAELPPSRAGANGEIALGALVVLVSLILIAFKPVFAVLIGLGGLIIVLGVVHRLTWHPAPGRVLGVSYADFVQRFGSLPLRGVIEAADAVQRGAASASTVVVCDSAETAAAIAANLATAGLETVKPVEAAAVPSPIPWPAVAVLHDASPVGCALPLDLRDAGAEVIDCGLRPAWVDSPFRQTLEGAPARLPRELRPLLEEQEVSWLASGRRVEMATLTPEQLMVLLRAALDGGPERVAGVRVFEPDLERTSFLGPHSPV